MTKTVLLITLILFSITIFADEKLPTKLSSNSAICRRQNNENICSYLGNAKLNQGKTNLQAEQIVIYKTANDKINKIVASGKHSHYSATMDKDKKPINADADLITIYPKKNMMVLEGNGQVVAGQDKYSGPHIEYQFK